MGAQRRAAFILAFAAPATGLLALVVLLAPSSSADVTTSPFQASASAVVVQVATILPGSVLTDEPVDSGGPTGQASLDSVGGSSGYAAFPDPGPFIVSLPGLGAGALAGTPASALPAPGYPLAVSASPVDPSARAGSGPVALEAKSSPTSSEGSANDTIVVPGVGQVATASGHASVTVQPDGSVVSTATSTVQGLTVGPLDLGDVTTTATETLSPSGQITPRSSITVDGAHIGGVPVTITPSDADNPTVDSALAADHLQLTFATGRALPGEVVAPALVITGPLQTTPATSTEGKFTISLGSAIASMAATAPSGSATAGDEGSFGASSGTGGGTSSAATPDVSTGAAAPAVASPPSSPAASVSAVPATAQTGQAGGVGVGSLAGNPSALVGLFDIRSLYLAVIAVALAAVFAAQLVRWIGVRGPWTSSTG